MKKRILLVVALVGVLSMVLTIITSATTQPQFPGVRLVTTTTLRCEAGDVIGAVTVTNNGDTAATNVQLTQATLLSPNQNGSPLPQSYGSIAPAQSVTHDVSFGTYPSGQRALRTRGTFTGGTFGSTQAVNVPPCAEPTPTPTPTPTPAGQLLLNEVEIDPPSTETNSCQYAEVRGNPGGLVPASTYFLSVNSDAGNFGFANHAVNFGGLSVGGNGTITLNNTASVCNRIFPADTTLLNYASSLPIGQGSETYLVVQSTSVLFSGQDLDTNDDGIFDASLGITVIDGFALLVNPEEEFVYGAEVGIVNISNTTSLDQPDAVTRFVSSTTPFVSAAFFFGELAASPDEAIQYVAPLSPNAPACPELTPGAPNVQPVACPTPTPTPTPAGQLLLNEIEVDPPSTTSDACQYTEVRGLNPGGLVPANTYFLSVNSDIGNFGFANQAVNIGGQLVGANGTITLLNNFSGPCVGRVFPADTTVVTFTSPNFIGQGSETYLIVQSTATLFSGQDLDTDDDGLFDPALGITVIDGFALLVNPEEEFVYGSEVGVVNISNPGLDQPDAVTRFLLNTTPFASGAFYWGELASSPDSATAYVPPQSANFPPGGALTPGAPNSP